MTEEAAKNPDGTRMVVDHADWLAAELKDVTTVYTDLDNTLVGPGGSLFLTSDKELSIRPAQALISAARKKLDVVVVSGRGRRQLFGDTRLMGLDNFIAELGALLVYNGGRRVVQNVGQYGEPGESVYDTIAKSGVCPFLFKSFDGFLEYHTPWSEGREVTHVLRGFVDAAAVCSLLDESGYHGLKLVDNGVIHSKGGLGDVPEVHAYHITPEAADKASGVSKDQELRGISPDESVALGDSVSDLVLAQHVKVMFVVRNGFEDDSHMRDQIRRYDNVFVTENPAGLGFAEAIELLRI